MIEEQSRLLYHFIEWNKKAIRGLMKFCLIILLDEACNHSVKHENPRSIILNRVKHEIYLEEHETSRLHYYFIGWNMKITQWSMKILVCSISWSWKSSDATENASSWLHHHLSSEIWNHRVKHGNYYFIGFNIKILGMEIIWWNMKFLGCIIILPFVLGKSSNKTWTVLAALLFIGSNMKHIGSNTKLLDCIILSEPSGQTWKSSATYLFYRAEDENHLV